MTQIRISSNNQYPLVSIGVAVYNRPELLSRALLSITNQSYNNIEIVISDDCSPNEDTKKVIRSYSSKDPRIKKNWQEKNLGMLENLKFVFEKSSGEFFVWCDEDDECHEQFIERGICSLLDHPRYEAWCCTMNNIDAYGRVIREYSGFSKWTSTNNKWKDILKFLIEPEILGKSHIFYCIFRRDALKRVIDEYFVTDNWGTDNCFAAAVLTRLNVLATDDVLFYKRVILPHENDKQFTPMEIGNPQKFIFPFKGCLTHLHEYYLATRTTPYVFLVIFVMTLRIPIAFRNEYFPNFSIWTLQKSILWQIIKKGFLKIKISLISIFYWLLFNVLFWKFSFHYKKDAQIVDVRWRTVETIGVIDAPIDLIFAPICTEKGNQLMHIENTPHYRWIKDLIEGKVNDLNKNEYFQYNRQYFPDENADEQLNDVTRLVSEISSQKNPTIEILTYPPNEILRSDISFRIFDGVHRAAIAKSLGYKIIKCRIVVCC